MSFEVFMLKMMGNIGLVIDICYKQHGTDRQSDRRTGNTLRHHTLQGGPCNKKAMS